MKVSLFTAAFDESKIRRFTKVKTIEVPDMPSKESVFYDETSKLSYQITTVFFTKDRACAIVTLYELAQTEPFEVMFPKRKLLHSSSDVLSNFR